MDDHQPDMRTDRTSSAGVSLSFARSVRVSYSTPLACHLAFCKSSGDTSILLIDGKSKVVLVRQLHASCKIFGDMCTDFDSHPSQVF